MTFSVRLFLRLLLSAGLLLVAGCETRLNLTMKKDLPPIDRSVVSPKLKDKKFTKIIIVPSPNADRSALEPRIMLIERAFLRLGVTVISPAITGRVVMDSTDKVDEKKAEALRDLSDMERALVMSHATGAEAILELENFKWTFPEVKTRYFIGDEKDESDFREVPYEQWASWYGQKRFFDSPVLIFAGRVLAVDTGETLASFDISMPANFTLPQDYKAKYKFDPIGDRLTKSRLIGEYSFVYNDPSWRQRAMDRTEAKVMEHMAESFIAMPPTVATQTAPVVPAPVRNPEKESTGEAGNKTAKVSAFAATVEKKTSVLRHPAVYAGHVASFKNETNAVKFVNGMKAKGLPAFYRKENIPGKGSFYRSYIGDYKTGKQAQKALGRLKKSGTIDYFQVRKIVATGGESREAAKLAVSLAAGKGAAVSSLSGAPDRDAQPAQDGGMKKEPVLKPGLSAEEHFNLGLDHIAKEQYQPALSELGEAIGQNDQFAAAYNKRCFVFYITGDVESAVKDCTKAIGLKADYAEAHYHRGLAYQADNQTEAAIADYGKAIAIDSRYEEAYAKRGYVYYLSRQNRQAIDDYTAAIGMKPDHGELYLNRALAYYDLGDADKAMADVRKACELKNEQACKIARDLSGKE